MAARSLKKMETSLPTKDVGPRKALGRGLAALIPSGPAPATSAASAGYRILPIERLHPNKKQPRKYFDEAALADLSASIKEQGILQPVVVRRQGDGYEIVAGERRWRAATRAGLQEIPAIVKDLSDSTALQIALIENVQRQDLDPLEEAEAYGRLIREHKLTHEVVAKAVGKSRAAITNSLRMLKLPEEILNYLADGRLTPGHARALMMLPDKASILRLAEDIVGRNSSVREAESKARALLKKKRGAAPAEAAGGAAETSVEDRLRKALGAKVKLHHKDGKGYLEIHFHSLDALDTLMDKLLAS
jgi:ParB family chromosome partitioning protein